MITTGIGCTCLHSLKANLGFIPTCNMSNYIQQLAPEDHEWLLCQGNEMQLTSYALLIDEGEEQGHIYFVLSGLFSIGLRSDERSSIVGPGSILGLMSFLTKKQKAFGTVSALDGGGTVLSVSQKSINSRIASDVGFEARFYRMSASFMADRLNEMIDSSIGCAAIDADASGEPLLRCPAPIFSENQPDFSYIQQTIDSLAPIEKLFSCFKGSFHERDVLDNRTRTLNVATLSTEGLRLLLQIAQRKGLADLDQRVIRHAGSVRAVEKQKMLPAYLVQKTLTIKIAGKLVLCSGLGDFKISRKILGDLSTLLGLSRRGNNSHINPASFIPEIELGMLRGMVSTFFSPGRITQLSLVAFIKPSEHLKDDVAVSLSPSESLIFPCQLFADIVQAYAEEAYPHVPFSLLPANESMG